MDKILTKLEKRNPYPEDIFTPLKKEEINRYVTLLVDNGFSSERIHAHWMRYAWKLCIDELKNVMKNETRKINTTI